jgi:hypothetical protein
LEIEGLQSKYSAKGQRRKAMTYLGMTDGGTFFVEIKGKVWKGHGNQHPQVCARCCMSDEIQGNMQKTDFVFANVFKKPSKKDWKEALSLHQNAVRAFNKQL